MADRNGFSHKAEPEYARTSLHSFDKTSRIAAMGQITDGRHRSYRSTNRKHLFRHNSRTRGISQASLEKLVERCDNEKMFTDGNWMK